MVLRVSGALISGLKLSRGFSCLVKSYKSNLLMFAFIAEIKNNKMSQKKKLQTKYVKHFPQP